MATDILQPISLEILLKIRDLYKQDCPRKLYIYNYLNTAVQWKIKFPNTIFIEVLVPNGEWQNGTFVAIGLYNWYEVVICTLATDTEVINQIIFNTKRIDWNKKLMVYGIHSNHYITISKALNKIEFPLLRYIPCDAWWIPADEARQFEVECDSYTYLEELSIPDSIIINDHWPYKNSFNSHKYIEFLIKVNGGYGVFLKSTNQLVAWILKIQIGMGMLHVVKEHVRKGYGCLVTKALAKSIAQNGCDPLVTVVTNNLTAQKLFSKLGFQKSELVTFIESKEPEIL